jgi:transcriptional regulator with XRE-family HTH domain
MNPIESIADRASGRAPVSEAAVLSKAAVRAAKLLDLTQRDVSAALGVSEATASRLFTGKYLLSPDRAKEWELARLFVRMFRSLDALWGHEETARQWLEVTTWRSRRVPGPIALSRGNGPCRHVPGRRTRSPLRPRRYARMSGVPSRRSTWCRRGHWSTRSPSNMCWSASSRG